MRSLLHRPLLAAAFATLAWSTAGCLAPTPTWGRVSEIHHMGLDFFYSYNEEGQLVGVTSDPVLDLAISYGADGPDEITLEGGEKSFAYTYEDGRLVERFHEEPEFTTTMRCIYDGDLLVEIERTFEGSLGSSTRLTTFTYDDDARLVEKAQDVGADSLFVDTFEYDEDGQLDQTESLGIGPTAETTRYGYEDGRLRDYAFNSRYSIDVQYNDDNLLFAASVEGESNFFEVTYEEGPVTGLAATLPMLHPPFSFFFMAPYFDHMGRSFGGVDMATLSFFLE